MKVIENVTRSNGVPFQSKWRPFCPKPLEIRTKWAPFCSEFQWLGFRMVETIAIAIALIDHSQTIGNPNFKSFCIRYSSPRCSKMKSLEWFWFFADVTEFVAVCSTFPVSRSWREKILSHGSVKIVCQVWTVKVTIQIQ